MANRSDNAPKVFREARCIDCSNLFQSTGPNHKRCDGCALENKRRLGREYNRSKCARPTECQICGTAFQPDTHAHTKYCAPCAQIARSAGDKVRYAADVERHREYGRRHYRKNKSAILEKKRSPEGRRKSAAIVRVRRQRDPAYRLHCNISRLVHMSLRGEKSGRDWELLVGYSAARLKVHLERQFLKGMTWANYGPVWHVDHIVPRAEFLFTTADDPDFRACWALTNLRPLWSEDNIRKRDKRTLLL